MARWTVHTGDSLAWMKTLPDRHCSLWVTSPPYQGQRTYGIKFALNGQSWVDWLRPFIVEMCRTCSGIVIVNMSSPVRNWSYSPAVEWLVSDLTRIDGVVCGPSPFAWVKSQNHEAADGNGIPGSGSKHYQRRDWEALYTFAFPDRLPGKGRTFWSENTAYGKPPFYGAGGPFSNRTVNGERVNDPWGKNGRGNNLGGRERNGAKKKGTLANPPGQSRRANGVMKATAHTKRMKGKNHETGGTLEIQYYIPPVISNPGNVIRAPVGGGKLGCEIAHDGEAPMSRHVVDRFVSWYAAPGSIVGDPFCGTGTTGESAVMLGRRFIGCDVRESQTKLTLHRLQRTTRDMFAAAESDSVIDTAPSPK